MRILFAVSLVLAAQGCWGRSFSRVESGSEPSLPLREILAEQDTRGLEDVRADVEKLLQQEQKSEVNPELLGERQPAHHRSLDEEPQNQDAKLSILDLLPSFQSEERVAIEDRLDLNAILEQVLEEDERKRQKAQLKDLQDTEPSVEDNKDDKFAQPALDPVPAKEESSEDKHKDQEEERPVPKRIPVRTLKTRKNKKLPVAIIVTAPELAELGSKKKYKGTLTRNRGKYYDVTEDIPEVTVEVYDGRNRKKLLEFGGKGQRIDAIHEAISDEASDEDYGSDNEEQVFKKTKKELKRTKQHSHRSEESLEHSVKSREEELAAGKPSQSSIYKISFQHDGEDPTETYDDHELTGLNEERHKSADTVKRHKHKKKQSKAKQISEEHENVRDVASESVEEKSKKVLKHELESLSREKESEDLESQELRRLVLDALKDSSKSLASQDTNEENENLINESVKNDASSDVSTHDETVEDSGVVSKEQQQFITVEDLNAAAKEFIQGVVANDDVSKDSSDSTDNDNENSVQKHVKGVLLEASDTGSKSEDLADKHGNGTEDPVQDVGLDVSDDPSKGVDVDDDAPKKHFKDVSLDSRGVGVNENTKDSNREGDSEKFNSRDISEIKPKHIKDETVESEASKDIESKDFGKKTTSLQSDNSLHDASEDVVDKSESKSKDVENSANVSDKDSDSDSKEHLRKKQPEETLEKIAELHDYQTKDSSDNSEVNETLEGSGASDDELKKLSKESTVENSKLTLDKPEIIEEKSLSTIDESESNEANIKHNNKNESLNSDAISADTKENVNEENLKSQSVQEPDEKQFMIIIKPNSENKELSEEAIAEQLGLKLIESQSHEPESKEKSVHPGDLADVEIESSEPKNISGEVSNEATTVANKDEESQRKSLTVPGSVAPKYIDHHGNVLQGHQAPLVHASSSTRRLEDDESQSYVQKQALKDKRTRAHIVVSDDQNDYKQKDMAIKFDARHKNNRAADVSDSLEHKIKTLPEASKYYNLSFVFNR